MKNSRELILQSSTVKRLKGFRLIWVIMLASLLSSSLAAQPEPLSPAVRNSYSALRMGSNKLQGDLIESVVFIQENFIKTWNWDLAIRTFRDQLDNNPTGTNWNGEFWGKVMRGSCLTFEYTQDEALYAIMESSTRALLTTQHSNGRISSFADFNEMRRWDLWCQKYVLLGLQYFYDICRDATLKKSIYDALCRETDYILTKIGNGPGQISIVETNPNMLGLPETSILEPMVRMYTLTGEQRYLDFSNYIIDAGGTSKANIFQLALDGKLRPFEWPIYTHGYASMACFEGLIEYFRATGEAKWLPAIRNFYNLLKESDVTIIGATGCAFECLSHCTVMQSDPAVAQGLIQELCGVSTWIKLNDQMLRLFGESSFVDEIEKAAYNALLGAVHFEMQQGQSPFDGFTPLINSFRGRWGRNLGFCNCCIASAVSGTGILPKINVLQSDRGIALNLYMPGAVHCTSPTGKAVEIATSTGYPYNNGDITVTVNPATRDSFDIKLRIPGWSKDVRVAINGEPVAVTPGTYANISRTWAPGDIITLKFDMRARVVSSPDGKGLMEAIVRGPVVLARDKRFGEELDVRFITRDVFGYVDLKPSDTKKFKTRLEFEVPVTGGGNFHVADYASVGSTWSDESRYSVWLPNRNYIHVDAGKTYTFTHKNSLQMAMIGNDGILAKADAPPTLTANAMPFYFTLEKVEYGLYRIVQSGKYLTVNAEMASTPENKLPLTLMDRMDSSLQYWWVVPVADNEYFIINLERNLDIAGLGPYRNQMQAWIIGEPKFP